MKIFGKHLFNEICREILFLNKTFREALTFPMKFVGKQFFHEICTETFTYFFNKICNITIIMKLAIIMKNEFFYSCTCFSIVIMNIFFIIVEYFGNIYSKRNKRSHLIL